MAQTEDTARDTLDKYRYDELTTEHHWNILPWHLKEQMNANILQCAIKLLTDSVYYESKQSTMLINCRAAS